MENPFKNIITNEKLPEKIKEKVLSDVATIKLALDLADLAMIKYPASLDNLYNITKPTNKNN